jgi:PAS domain S-box-containing protein
LQQLIAFVSRVEHSVYHMVSDTDLDSSIQSLLDLSSDLTCVVGYDGYFRHLNCNWEGAVGFTSKELLERSMISWIHSDDQAGMKRAFKRARENKTAVSVECRFHCKNNDFRKLEWHLTSNSGRQLTYAIVRDRSDAQSARDTLQRREREILTLYRLSEILHSPLPIDDLYKEIVDEICSATGFPIATIAIFDEAKKKIVFRGSKGLPVQSGRSSSELPMEDTFSGVVVRTGKPFIITAASATSKYRSTVLRKAGAETFYGYPMMVGNKIIGALGLAHPESIEIDVHTAQWIQSLANYVAALTERKLSEEQLKRSGEQLRDLSAHLRLAVEEERKNIAREIHDELGQELSLLGLELGLLQAKLRHDQKDLRASTKSMAKLINSSIQTVRRISSDLRPMVLDNLGLGAATEWHTKEFQRRTRIRCELQVIPPEIRLDSERSTALFRILQEALTNVARHSKATRVKVRLEEKGTSISLTVRDNGIGLTKEQADDIRSYGLTGIRERVLHLGGTCTLAGSRGKGTQVSVTIPIQR